MAKNPPGIPGHIILFENKDFHGRHKHIFADFDNLAAADDNDFNDVTSSSIVISGWWTVYEDAFFSGNSWGTDTPDGALGPGLYSWVGDWGIGNDAISSLRIFPGSGG